MKNKYIIADIIPRGIGTSATKPAPGKINRFKYRPGSIRNLTIEIHPITDDLKMIGVEYKIQLGILHCISIPATATLFSDFQLFHNKDPITRISFCDDMQNISEYDNIIINSYTNLENVVQMIIEKYENNLYIPTHVHHGIQPPNPYFKDENNFRKELLNRMIKWQK